MNAVLRLDRAPRKLQLHDWTERLLLDHHTDETHANVAQSLLRE